MANYTISPNMQLPIPIAGQETGPQYATDINNALTVIDSHTHLPGSGVAITPDAININSDLTFNASNSGINMFSSQFASQASALGSTVSNAVYVVAGNLFYNNSAGTPVQITSGSSVVGSAGTITGLPSGTASASYASGTFVWQQSTNTSATMDAGNYILRNETAGSYGLTLQPPNLISDFTLTLPTIPTPYPALISMDTSGNMAAFVTWQGFTIGVDTDNTLMVNNGSITGSKIAAGTITGSNIAAGTIARTNIGNNQIESAQIDLLTITGGPSGNMGINQITGDNTTFPIYVSGAISSSQGVGTNTNFGQINITTNAHTQKMIWVNAVLNTSASGQGTQATCHFQIVVNGQVFASTQDIFKWSGTLSTQISTPTATCTGAFVGVANTTYVVQLLATGNQAGTVTVTGTLQAFEIR